MELQEVIGSYTKENLKQDYTKEMLKGDIALLTLEIGTKIINYMNDNGYQDVYIVPLITEIQKSGMTFIEKIQ